MAAPDRRRFSSIILAAASTAASRMWVTPPSPMPADGMAATTVAPTGMLRFTTGPGMAARASQRARWPALPSEPRQPLPTAIPRTADTNAGTIPIHRATRTRTRTGAGAGANILVGGRALQPVSVEGQRGIDIAG